MNLPPLNIPAIMRQFGLHTDKSLGQNFLIDDHAIRRVVEAAGISPQDYVLEIGAGLGNLTRHLAANAREVVAVEIDDRLTPALKYVLKPFSNVRLVVGDILAFNPENLFPDLDVGQGYVVAANIPYYITSAVIRHLLSVRLRPRQLALTIQREVAERICARPGDLSLLALSVQVYGIPDLAAHIPASAFLPPPKVDSAVVRVRLFPQPYLPEEQLDTFFRLIKAGFSQKRKTLRNSLSGGLAVTPAQANILLEQSGIDPQRRAETLHLDEWRSLVDSYQRAKST